MNIALTFDIESDNPNFLNSYFGIKSGLLKIINILDYFNIKGTFFCTGNVAKNYPDYVKLIEDKGHEIACHGLNHNRLNKLNFRECQDLIYQSKTIIENVCQNSKIIGFRSPYLKPPIFLFKILDNLGFRYDSSIKFPKDLKYFQFYNNRVQEFHPSESSIFFRLPLSYQFLRRKIFSLKLSILYFHPWEAIDMNKLIFNQSLTFKVFKKIIFRPDRWVNTGDSFIIKLSYFIKESLFKKAKFITLRQLVKSERNI